MIKFQSSNNIAITKRTENTSHTSHTSHPSSTKNTEKKEKSSNNVYKPKNLYKNNINNNCFNKSNLSLTSLKLKSIPNKKTQNIKSSQITKKLSNPNITSIKNTKNNYFKNTENDYHKRNNSNINSNDYYDLSVNKKTRLNRNVNGYNNDNLFLCCTNNNDNLSTNYISINENRFDLSNMYPKPEPMPIKINKNNYFYNNSIYNKYSSDRNNNNDFNPDNLISNNDKLDNRLKGENSVYNYFEKIQNDKAYYSTLQKFYENNNNKFNKNLINKKNIITFIENIENTNNKDYNNKNIMDNCNKKYDEKVIYVLNHLDLDNLIDIFNKNYIKFNDLFLLTKQDFIEMNVPIGQRNRFFHFLEKYKNYAKNYDFDEIKLFLDIFSGGNNNNIFNKKNAVTFPYKQKNNNEDNYDKNMNTKENFGKDNESNKLFNPNYTIDLTKIEHVGNLQQSKSQIKEKQVNNNTQSINNNDKNNNTNKNISNFKRNNSNLDLNKNGQTFSSVSNLKATSVYIENSNHKNDTQEDNYKKLFKKGTKNNSEFYSNKEKKEPNNTTEATGNNCKLKNNKSNSNIFLQECQNILDEVDNFNTIYSKMKQKSLNRNKQISILLSKKNNIEYIREKLNYKEKKSNKRNNNKNMNKKENLCGYDLNELKLIKEESIRDLNKELNV